MKDTYAARLGSFAEAHGPFKVMCRAEKRSPTIGMEDGIYFDWNPEIRSKRRQPCDCCGNWMLKARIPLKAKSGLVYMVGVNCWDNLQDLGHIINERPNPPPEELRYHAK